MTLASYFGYATNSFPQTPFIFDEFGDVRWYIDFRSSAELSKLFCNDGMERLENGNLYLGPASRRPRTSASRSTGRRSRSSARGTCARHSMPGAAR